MPEDADRRRGEQELRQKPTRFRERLVPRRQEHRRSPLTLPSCYGKIERGKAAQHVFQRMVKGNHVASVSVDYPGGVPQNAQEHFYDSLLADLKRAARAE